MSISIDTIAQTPISFIQDEIGHFKLETIIFVTIS